MSRACVRCPWPGTDPLYLAYHDELWGVPLMDDGGLFALLILEGAQAGLSWITILRRMPGYLEAFEGLDPHKMALYDEEDINRLMNNPGIIRNRRKIQSAVGNARAFLEFQAREGSFATFLWSAVDGRPVDRGAQTMADVPASTRESEVLSRELKRRGFSFCGPTIVYALMQAAGLVNDHLRDCFRYEQIRELPLANPEDIDYNATVRYGRWIHEHCFFPVAQK